MAASSDIRGIAEIIYRKVPEYFFEKVVKSPKNYCRRLIIVSPWITRMPLQQYSLSRIVRKIKKENIETIIFTRPYETEPEYHQRSLKLLSSINAAKIFVNPNLHAKFYISLGRQSDFALFGSANLTHAGNVNYEVGIFFYSHSWGKQIINELKKTALTFLRLQSDTSRWK